MPKAPWMTKKTEVSLVTKYFLFFFNFLVCLSCGAITGLMAWVLVEKDKKVENMYDFFLDPACFLCLVGSIAVFVSFFGWFGSLRENIFTLKCYRYILLFLFLVEVTFIILIFVIVYVPNSRQQLKIYPENSLKEAIVKYRDDEDMQNLIDGIQLQLDCCGTSNDDEGYKDWTKNAYFNCSSGTNTLAFGEFCSVPFSCCKDSDDGLVNYMCGKDMQSTDMDATTRSQTIYERGCFKAITSILEENVLVVGGVIIGILIPQMFLTAITGNLIYQIKAQWAKYERSQRQMQQNQLNPSRPRY